MRYGNIEFRWSDCNKKYELIRWFEDQHGFKPPWCTVIAFFQKDKEGYNMVTVGNRFFEDEDAWLVGKHALGFLQDVFKLED